MKLLIEFDGPIVDISSAGYEAYCLATSDVDWSQLDQGTFRRTLRNKGADSNLLQGAKPLKVKAFLTAFAQRCEQDDVLARCFPHAGLHDTLRRLTRAAECVAFTLGQNLPARERLLSQPDLDGYFDRVAVLNMDPRQRPGELSILAGSERRTIVVAATDSVIRAAGAAELLAVGISAGSSSKPRLYRAGADLVYSSLAELAEALVSGGKDLIRAGLLPPSPE